MKRLLVPIVLLLASMVLETLLGCEASSVGSDISAADSDSDSDSDGDADSDVDVVLPEHINPHLDMSGAMTGPISPPPENVDELAPGDGDVGPAAPDPVEQLLLLLLEGAADAPSAPDGTEEE